MQANYPQRAKPYSPVTRIWQRIDILAGKLSFNHMRMPPSMRGKQDFMRFSRGGITWTKTIMTRLTR
jgi:hypothetical protein